MLMLLLVAGFVIGTLSGMLGIGGGILMAPVLLFVPGWLGLPGMSMKAISGLTMVQGLVGSASGYLAHRRYRAINPKLIYLMGPVIIITSYSGAHLSGMVDDVILKAVFAFMAFMAALLMLVKNQEMPATVPAEEVEFNRPLAILVAAVIGFTGGLVGQGGSFLLVPALINVLNLPTKVAMGSNLGVVLFASLAGLGGKVSAGLVEPLGALALTIGVVPGAQLGGYLSHRLNSVILKRILSLLIVLVSLQIWWDLLQPMIIKSISMLPLNLILLYSITVMTMVLSLINAGLLVWLVRTSSRERRQRQKSSI